MAHRLLRIGFLLVPFCAGSACAEENLQQMFTRVGQLREEAGDGPDASRGETLAENQSLRRIHKLRDASALMRTICEAKPDVGELWMALGDLLSLQHEWASARSAFEKGTQLNAALEVAGAAQLGSAMRKAGLTNKGCKVLRQAVSIKDGAPHGYAKVWYELGLCYSLQSEKAEATALQTGNTTAVKTVRTLRHSAISAFQAALRHEPNQWQSNANLGSLLLKLVGGSTQLLQEARVALEKAVKSNPSETLANSGLIQALTWLGKTHEARSAMRQAVAHGALAQVGQYPGTILSIRAAKQQQPWPDMSQPLYAGVQRIVLALEAASASIRQEVLSALIRGNEARLLPSIEGLHAGDGQWGALRVDCSSSPHQRLFPSICYLLSQDPGASADVPAMVRMAQILRLQANTHIRPHCGPDNRRLVIHLGLLIPPCAQKVPPCVSLRCGGRSETWSDGKCLLFDDSFEHAVQHNGNVGDDRIVLGLQVSNPILHAASSSHVEL